MTVNASSPKIIYNKRMTLLYIVVNIKDLNGRVVYQNDGVVKFDNVAIAGPDGEIIVRGLVYKLESG